MQDLDRYLQNVQIQTQVNPTPSAPVAHILALEAEVHQQEARMSFLNTQLEQSDGHRRAEAYMGHMVQKAEAFQQEETWTREENQRGFESHCEQSMHQH